MAGVGDEDAMGGVTFEIGWGRDRSIDIEAVVLWFGLYGLGRRWWRSGFDGRSERI